MYLFQPSAVKSSASSKAYLDAINYNQIINNPELLPEDDNKENSEFISSSDQTIKRKK